MLGCVLAAVEVPVVAVGVEEILLRLLFSVPEEEPLCEITLLLSVCVALLSGVCDAATPLVAVLTLLRLVTWEEALTLSAETAVLLLLALALAVLPTLWVTPLRAAKPLAIAVS